MKLQQQTKAAGNGSAAGAVATIVSRVYMWGCVCVSVCVWHNWDAGEAADDVFIR